jgi:hypothetical protein
MTLSRLSITSVAPVASEGQPLNEKRPASTQALTTPPRQFFPVDPMKVFITIPPEKLFGLRN